MSVSIEDPVSGLVIPILEQRQEFIGRIDNVVLDVNGPSDPSSIPSSSSLSSIPSSAAAAKKKKPQQSTGVMDVMLSEEKDAKTRGPAADNMKWEYLDHTADIQLHTWGDSLKEAFEGQIIAMVNYITDLRYVVIDPNITDIITVEAHDMQSLLFAFMDEFLNRFNTYDQVCKRVKIMDLQQSGQTFKIKARFEGEKFNDKKHKQGTEIKAITYSNMQILDNSADANAKHPFEVYTIVDI